MAELELNGKFIFTVNDKIVGEVKNRIVSEGKESLIHYQPSTSIILYPPCCTTCQTLLNETEEEFCGICQPTVDDIKELMHDPHWRHAIRGIVNIWTLKDQLEALEHARSRESQNTIL